MPPQWGLMSELTTDMEDKLSFQKDSIVFARVTKQFCRFHLHLSLPSSHLTKAKKTLVEHAPSFMLDFLITGSFIHSFIPMWAAVKSFYNSGSEGAIGAADRQSWIKVL